MTIGYLTTTYQHVHDVRYVMEDIMAQLEEAIRDVRKACGKGDEGADVLEKLELARESCEISASICADREREVSEALREAECAARAEELRQMVVEYWHEVM